ncbi:hypothetical protein HF1_07390 [Mycoplasma haemofelis str. Langford 1]|uniref:Uncharacterized protein n=1 Tax=Mycoplasma haemofelis (strain Langford 1) TaxID=941640 RepID=E8ZHX6_MYCHL|nr:hypothetical protein [Mycoplasma haemofelis]CBY92747.1 hypothetical protein HF1_07390 [Mycoplasma haemofelis str. Langford 1]
MSLGFLKLASIGAVGVGGTAGTVYLGSKVVDFSGVEGEQDDLVEVVADRFKDRLVKDTTKDKSKWDVRFQKLKQDTSGKLHTSLKQIKEDNQSKADDLKVWCTDAYIKPVEDETFSNNVEQYCTLFIKDQIGSLITEKSEDKWTENNSVLEKKDKKSLSKEMKKIQEELKTKKNALSTWCLGQHDSFYKGKDDSTYKDVHGFCRKIPKKTPKTPDSKATPAPAESKPKAAPVASQPAGSGV